MLLRSHGGGNCSGDGGAHEGGPDLHPTANNTNCMGVIPEGFWYDFFCSQKLHSVCECTQENCKYES